MNNMKTYYHATPYRNLESILDQGIFKGCDGVVYLADTKENAAKFIAIRGCFDILVCEVQLNEANVEESFDHSETFFKCKAYIYNEDINVCEISNMWRYDLFNK